MTEEIKQHATGYRIAVTKPRLEKEKAFFDQTFEREGRQSLSKFYQITASSRDCYKTLVLADCGGRKVLEYGCGKGSYAFDLARCGSEVIGIDISEVAVELAAGRAGAEGLTGADFEVMDAEATRFEENTFDKICGTGILHHLNLSRALPEVVRILKPEGEAVFKEPLGHNPLINLFRRLTPGMRTEDEHPLLRKDLKQIRGFFDHHEYRYFHFLSIAAVPFRNFRVFAPLLALLDYTDRKLFAWFPFMRSWAWQVILILRKPRSAVDE